MKNAITIWKWSLRVVARSPRVLIALSTVVVIGLFGAFRWLYFPMESAVYLMVIGLLWAVVQYFVLVSLFTATAFVTGESADSSTDRLNVRSLVRFGRCHWLRCAGFLVIAGLFVQLLRFASSFLEEHSLEVASFLTFRSEKPVAPETVEAVFGWIETLLWVVALGFLLSFLLALVRGGWRAALRATPRLFGNSCWRTPFLTGVISLVGFGGLAYMLATWIPKAPPGFLDYAQLIIRNGLALVLVVAGLLFWLLSLARHDSLTASSVSGTAVGNSAEPSISDS